jgi:hypothetical protein
MRVFIPQPMLNAATAFDTNHGGGNSISLVIQHEYTVGNTCILGDGVCWTRGCDAVQAALAAEASFVRAIWATSPRHLTTAAAGNSI